MCEERQAYVLGFIHWLHLDEIEALNVDEISKDKDKGLRLGYWETYIWSAGDRRVKPEGQRKTIKKGGDWHGSMSETAKGQG